MRSKVSASCHNLKMQKCSFFFPCQSAVPSPQHMKRPGRFPSPAEWPISSKMKFQSKRMFYNLIIKQLLKSSLLLLRLGLKSTTWKRYNASIKWQYVTRKQKFTAKTRIFVQSTSSTRTCCSHLQTGRRCHQQRLGAFLPLDMALGDLSGTNTFGSNQPHSDKAELVPTWWTASKMGMGFFWSAEHRCPRIKVIGSGCYSQLFLKNGALVCTGTY